MKKWIDKNIVCMVDDMEVENHTKKLYDEVLEKELYKEKKFNLFPIWEDLCAMDNLFERRKKDTIGFVILFLTMTTTFVILDIVRGSVNWVTWLFILSCMFNIYTSSRSYTYAITMGKEVKRSKEYILDLINKREEFLANPHGFEKGENYEK